MIADAAMLIIYFFSLSCCPSSEEDGLFAIFLLLIYIAKVHKNFHLEKQSLIKNIGLYIVIYKLSYYVGTSISLKCFINGYA